MHRIIAAALVAGTCASALQAQDPPTEPPEATLTLQVALARAGATSPAIDVSTAGVAVAQAQRSVAAQRPNPTIVAEVENIGGSGAFNGLRSAETTLGLALPIELGGKRSARIGVANAQQSRARLGSAIAEADLRLRVTQAYNEAAAAQRRLATASDQVGIAAEVLRAARVRVAAGRVSPLEEQRADVARINAEGARQRAERDVALAFGNLARLTGLPVRSVDLAWFARVGAVDLNLVAGAADTLSVAAALADFTTATAQVRLTRAQTVPDVTVSASARRLEVSNDVAAVFGVSLPLRIFNRGRASINVAAAERDQADAVRRMANRDAEQAIASAMTELANAETSALNATGPALAAAQEAARIARIGYREGKFGQLDLLDAERMLLATRTTAIDALAAYHDAQARLERLTARAPSSTEEIR